MLQTDNSLSQNKKDIVERLNSEHHCRTNPLKPDNQPHSSRTSLGDDLRNPACSANSPKGDEKKQTQVPNLSEGTLPPHTLCNGPFSIISRSPLDPSINIELNDALLWNKFARQHTEMIVTKPGRRIFPAIRLKVSGMEPSAIYCIIMDVVPVDDHRYKYQNGKWIIAGRGEPPVQGTYFIHPTSPARGSKWMQDLVSFQKVKLTNSCNNVTVGKFLIHSMHQYQPRFHVIRADDVSNLQGRHVSTFSFSQTSFITVTAYQNNDITKLKVDNNPFARGFRNNGGKTLNAQIFSSEMHRVGQRYLHHQDQHRWRDDSYLLQHRQDMVSQNSNWSNRTISLSAPSLSSQPLQCGFMENPGLRAETTHNPSRIPNNGYNQLFPPYQQSLINHQRFGYYSQSAQSSTTFKADLPSSSRTSPQNPQKDISSFQHPVSQEGDQLENQVQVCSSSLGQCTEVGASLQNQYYCSNPNFASNNVVQDQAGASHQGFARTPTSEDEATFLPNQNFNNNRFSGRPVAIDRHFYQQNSPETIIQAPAPGVPRYSHDARSSPQNAAPVQMAQNSTSNCLFANYQHQAY